jgi:hypothetical protein
MATTLEEVRNTRRQSLRNFQQEVGLYVAAHPELTFKQVAGTYQCSQTTVSQAARSVGLKPRRQGRKKQQTPTPVEAK